MVEKRSDESESSLEPATEQVTTPTTSAKTQPDTTTLPTPKIPTKSEVKENQLYLN